MIGANLDPVSGDAPGETPFAAAIFLHRHSYTAGGQAKPTSGCVSLAAVDLVDIPPPPRPGPRHALRHRPDRLAPHHRLIIRSRELLASAGAQEVHENDSGRGGEGGDGGREHVGVAVDVGLGVGR